MKGGRAWTWILSVPLAAVLLYLSLRGVDWKGVWQTIAGAYGLHLHFHPAQASAYVVTLALGLPSLYWIKAPPQGASAISPT